VRIHLAGEHALELELVDAARIALDVLGDRVGGVLVVFQLDEVEQLVGSSQPLAQAADAVDGLVEQRAFASQRLGAFGIVPDIGAFQFPIDFFQAFDLGVVVKETP
jgi:hypothetical protein